MDIADLKPKSNTVVVELKDPRDGSPFMNDDNTPMTIELYAPHSKEYKQIIYEQADKRIKGKKQEFTAFELEEANLTMLVKATKGWDITLAGEKPKCTQKKVEEVYDTYFWVRSQVEEGLNNYEVFTKG